MNTSKRDADSYAGESTERHWKVGFFVVLGILLVSNFFWFSALLDAGLSSGDAVVKLDESEHESILLADLLIDSHRGSTQAQIMSRLIHLRPELSPVQGNDIIAVDGVDFIFVNDRLVGVD